MRTRSCPSCTRSPSRTARNTTSPETSEASGTSTSGRTFPEPVTVWVIARTCASAISTVVALSPPRLLRTRATTTSTASTPSPMRSSRVGERRRGSRAAGRGRPPGSGGGTGDGRAHGSVEEGDGRGSISPAAYSRRRRWKSACATACALALSASTSRARASASSASVETPRSYRSCSASSAAGGGGHLAGGHRHSGLGVAVVEEGLADLGGGGLAEVLHRQPLVLGLEPRLAHLGPREEPVEHGEGQAQPYVTTAVVPEELVPERDGLERWACRGARRAGRPRGWPPPRPW
jgi:hypothetical protein